MSDQRKGGIAWTDATWNPVRGCSRVSPGCTNCYAETMAARFGGPGLPYEGLAKRVGGEARWTGKVALVPERLADPLRWQRPRRIFVNSMSDLFHESLSSEDIAAVFGVMAAAPQHTFQVLTKRATRMREWFTWVQQDRGCGLYSADAFVQSVAHSQIEGFPLHKIKGTLKAYPWPLTNVWLGVSVEDQEHADARIPHLLATPAAVRFVSYEPALGSVSFRAISGLSRINVRSNRGFVDALTGETEHAEARARGGSHLARALPRLDWVIVGGESGHGARPMHPDWPRSVVDQCKAAGVACFMKQRGAWMPKSWGALAGRKPWGTLTAAGKWWPETTPWNGHTLDDSPEREDVMVCVGGHGADPLHWPEYLRVQEFPK